MEIHTPEYKNIDFLDKKYFKFSDLKKDLDEWTNLNFVPIKIRNSKLIKQNDQNSSDIVYTYIYYSCTFIS